MRNMLCSLVLIGVLMVSSGADAQRTDEAYKVQKLRDDVDSLVTVISGPEPRTVGDPDALFASTDLTAEGAVRSFTLPVAGVALDGAVSAVLVLEWKSFTGNFSLEHVLSTAQGDTSVTTLVGDTTLTKIWIDSLYVRQNATKEVVTIPLSKLFEGGYLQGYYHVRIKANYTTDLENCKADLVVGY